MGYRGAAPYDARAVGITVARLARVAVLRRSLLRSYGGDSRVSAGVGIAAIFSRTPTLPRPMTSSMAFVAFAVVRL